MQASLDEFEATRERLIDEIFRANPDVKDHRSKHTWLTNSLGDPFAGIWFIAENPSLRQIEKLSRQSDRALTVDAQWSASEGDQLLREALIGAGFKTNSQDEVGGWECYITNLIKEADYAERWKKKGLNNRIKAAELWAPALNWEIRVAAPRLVVAMGRNVERLLQRLVKKGLVSLPRVMFIHHYSYVASRARGKLGPMHPSRVEEYHRQMMHIRSQFDTMRDDDISGAAQDTKTYAFDQRFFGVAEPLFPQRD